MNDNQDHAAQPSTSTTENSQTAQPIQDEQAPDEESNRKRKADDTQDSNQDDTAKKAKNEEENKNADQEEDDDDDDGAFCPICFEPWTNSGQHRIASLKCGHFFGQSCIEKWLRSSGDDCPNCNEKATKRDVRLHYVARLKAVDTAEKDRAVDNLEKVKCQLQTLEHEHTTLKVTNSMQREEIDKLRRQLRQICPDPSRLALLEESSAGAAAAAAKASTSGSA